MDLNERNVFVLFVRDNEIRLDAPDGPTLGQAVSHALGIDSGRVKAEVVVTVDILPVNREGGVARK